MNGSDAGPEEFSPLTLDDARNWVRKIVSEYLLLSRRSSLLYWIFRKRMRPISVRRVQVLLTFTGLLVIVFWPEDFLLYKPPEVRTAFFYWRSLTVLLCFTLIGMLRYFEFCRRNLGLFYVGFISLNMMVGGYLFGSVRGLDYPWFDFLVFMVPMFSLVLSINLIRRFLVTSLLVASYVVFYLIASPENYQHPYLAQYFPLWTTAIVLNTVVGHSIYYFDYTTFRNERTLKHQQEEIQRVARHDQLTSLLTRSEFLLRSEEAFEQAKRHDNNLALMMIDLDHFKEINDTFGHLAGDQVLARSGRLIDHEIRRGDIAGRYGGEEFAIMMPQTSLEGARELAERLRRKLSNETFSTKTDEEFSVTCSIGLASLTNDTQNLEDLLRTADERMYSAKDSGRNCVVWSDKG